MLTINKNIQNGILISTMEKLVSDTSLFRKVNKHIDFTFIYNEVKELYCENNGKSSVDPALLFKLVFIQILNEI